MKENWKTDGTPRPEDVQKILGEPSKRLPQGHEFVPMDEPSTVWCAVGSGWCGHPKNEH